MHRAAISPTLDYGGSHRFEQSRTVATTPERLFEHLDDQTRLAAHMAQRSAAMGGGRMGYEFDSAAGKAVGSRIAMTGTAFGLRLHVEEVVTERDPPRQKVWRTVGVPRLLVIGGYQMGFSIEPRGHSSQLRVWIEYWPPPSLVGQALCALFGFFYARWCVRRMVADAAAARRPGNS